MLPAPDAVHRLSADSLAPYTHSTLVAGMRASSGSIGLALWLPLPSQPEIVTSKLAVRPGARSETVTTRCCHKLRLEDV